MGPANSNQKSQVDVSLDHPKFMHAKIITEKDSSSSFLQTVMGTQEQEYKEWEKQLKSSKLTNENLLLPDSDSFAKEGLCGNSGILTINYPNYPYLLATEIEQRKGQKKIFQEPDLWYLLSSLFSAKKGMKEANMEVGDIRPQNIFLNDKKHAKVANMLSWPGERNSLSKAFEDRITYLAPEDIKEFEKGNINASLDDPSEIFAIGLTALSTVLTTDMSCLYSIKGSEVHFDFNQATHYINAWKCDRRYSEIIRAFVSNLCEFSPAKRVTMEEVWPLLERHNLKIVNRQVFVIDEAPNKLHEEVMALRQQIPPQEKILQMPINRAPSPPLKPSFDPALLYTNPKPFDTATSSKPFSFTSNANYLSSPESFSKGPALSNGSGEIKITKIEETRIETRKIDSEGKQIKQKEVGEPKLT